MLVEPNEDYFKDGPLEKLWGGGEFSSRMNFFRYQIPCMNFFRPLHEYFLGLIGMQEFFQIKFSLARIFLVLPPPISFLMVRPLGSLTYVWFMNVSSCTLLHHSPLLSTQSPIICAGLCDTY